MPDEHLTWIVPCRRAVVKKRITYQTLMVKLKESLLNRKEKLKEWYDLGRSDDDLNKGMNQLDTWIDNMNPEGEIFVSRTSSYGSSNGISEGNTVDSRWAYVRLWKGPLRVLLEEKAGVTSDQNGAETVTQFTYQARPFRLVQNLSHKEVTNADAEFLMGDVVEFPIFKLLLACGLGDYNQISFNPNGSFLCGTSLLKNNQPHAINAEPKIHDNLIAMRFQLLLNLVRGAFYSLSPVFGSGTRNAPKAQDGSQTVYARGLIYGAIFWNPTGTLSQGYWRAANLGWGYKTDDYNVPKNVPTRNSLNVLAGHENPPITTGIACSPASLTLCSFLLNLNGWGEDSVDKELNPRRGHDPTTSIYWGKFEESPVSQDELLGRVQPENQQQAREALKRKINEILKELGEPPRDFACPCISDDKLQSLRRELKEEIRSLRTSGRLYDIWTKVNEQLRILCRRPQDSEVDQRETLWNIHRCFYQRFVDLRRRLEDLGGDPTWRQAELPPPDIDVSEWPTEPHPEEEQAEAQTLGHGINGGTINRIRRLLREKKEEIDSGDAYRDMSNTLHDISTFKLPAHELALVKIYPFDQLMTRTSLPLSGRIGAYDPLSGMEQFPEGGPANGQLFFFEATGSLAKFTRSNGQKVQACGLGPFNWERIENNSLYLKKEGGRIRYWKNNTQQGSGFSLSRVWRVRDEVLYKVYPSNESGSEPSPPTEFKPFVVLKPEDPNPVEPLGDYRIFFSDRAVPFPTFKEAVDIGNFPREDEIPPYLDTLLTEVTKALENHLSTATNERTEEDQNRWERYKADLEKFKELVERDNNRDESG